MGLLGRAGVVEAKESRVVLSSRLETSRSKAHERLHTAHFSENYFGDVALEVKGKGRILFFPFRSPLTQRLPSTTNKVHWIVAA